MINAMTQSCNDAQGGDDDVLNRYMLAFRFYAFANSEGVFMTNLQVYAVVLLPVCEILMCY